MKKPLAILLLLSSFIFGQNTKIDSLKSRVESLEKEKQNIDVAVERIKAEIQSLELEEKKKNLVSLIQDSVSVTVKTTKAYTIFYLGDSFSRKNGLEIGINEEVTIFPYLSHNYPM